MKLAIDIDNVVCNFVEAMIEFVNFNLETNYKPDDVTVWDFVDSPRIEIEYTKMMDLFAEFSALKLWGNAPLYKDSQEVLEWIDEHHDFIYLTNRPPEAEQKTINYFEKHGIPFVATHVLRDYDDDVCFGSIVFVNGHTKAEFAKRFGIDIAIEDKPKSIQEYIDAGIYTALKIEPYNDWIDYKDPHGKLYRCANLTEFRFLVEELEGK